MRLTIEFLYYDKTDCKRCVATYKAVKQAIKELELPIKLTEKKLPKSKTGISPSVRINGKDIEMVLHRKAKLKTNSCFDCCDTPVRCRTFTYKGRSCDYMPKSMIKDAINIILKKG